MPENTGGKPCAGVTGKAVRVKEGYCHTTCVGLGADNVHRGGNPSLEDCGNYALTDDRCSADGHFDAEKAGNKFQCKCPTGTCAQSSNHKAGGWTIYRMEHDECE